MPGSRELSFVKSCLERTVWNENQRSCVPALAGVGARASEKYLEQPCLCQTQRWRWPEHSPRWLSALYTKLEMGFLVRKITQENGLLILGAPVSHLLFGAELLTMAGCCRGLGYRHLSACSCAEFPWSPLLPFPDCISPWHLNPVVAVYP